MENRGTYSVLTMTTQNRVFGEVLRELRVSRRLSQDSLAYAAGLNRTYISLLELGQRGPTLTTMLALCHALDVPFSEMAREIEEALATPRSGHPSPRTDKGGA